MGIPQCDNTMGNAHALVYKLCSIDFGNNTDIFNSDVKIGGWIAGYKGIFMNLLQLLKRFQFPDNFVKMSAFFWRIWSLK